jgi:hypothetical protein
MRIAAGLFAALALALYYAGEAPAADDEKTVCCPRCRAHCVHTVEPETVTKPAWEVERKWICVPRVRFPWEPCDKPYCAWLRKVKVLKEVEYECRECRHKWKAVCESPSCLPQREAAPEPLPPAVPQTGNRPLLRPLFAPYDAPPAETGLLAPALVPGER